MRVVSGCDVFLSQTEKNALKLKARISMLFVRLLANVSLGITFFRAVWLPVPRLPPSFDLLMTVQPF